MLFEPAARGPRKPCNRLCNMTERTTRRNHGANIQHEAHRLHLPCRERCRRARFPSGQLRTPETAVCVLQPVFEPVFRPPAVPVAAPLLLRGTTRYETTGRGEEPGRQTAADKSTGQRQRSICANHLRVLHLYCRQRFYVATRSRS